LQRNTSNRALSPSGDPALGCEHRGRRNERVWPPGRGAAEIEIDTLVIRLHEDALAHERVTFLPRVVGASAAVP